MTPYQQKLKEREERRKRDEERLIKENPPVFKVGEIVIVVNDNAHMEPWWTFRIKELEPQFYRRGAKLIFGGYYYTLGNWGWPHTFERSGYSSWKLKKASRHWEHRGQVYHLECSMRREFRYIPWAIKERFFSDPTLTNENLSEMVEKYIESQLPPNPTLKDRLINLRRFYQQDSILLQKLEALLTSDEYSHREKEEVKYLANKMVSPWPKSRAPYKAGVSIILYDIFLQHKTTCPSSVLIEHKEILAKTRIQELEKIKTELDSWRRYFSPSHIRKEEAKYLKDIITPIEKDIEEIINILRSRPQDPLAQVSVLL